MPREETETHAPAEALWIIFNMKFTCKDDARRFLDFKDQYVYLYIYIEREREREIS